ncbi:hypothetical protein CRG98_025123 [Punica granatum]|uniref:Uncharacterized protein n=1 Tax=Punica granatum TaxID=22663 RepID=A0A2I0JEF6_PUNGR|nr:hypothetical protein CRG98_025123 [Punica granatum]
MEATDPTGALDIPDWHPARNKPEQIRQVVIGSDVTTVAPDGILLQGQWIPTPKRPPEVTVVVARRKQSRVDPICKENRKRIRQVGMEKKLRRWGGIGQGVAALGQPVGPTSLEGRSGRSSGLD